MGQNTAYIIDFSNLVYRYNFANASIKKNIEGVEIGYGNLIGIVNTLRSNPYQYWILVLDGTPTHTQKKLPQYKGNRGGDHDSKLTVSIAECVRFTVAAAAHYGKRVRVVVAPHYEADCVISSLVFDMAGMVTDFQKECAAPYKEELPYDFKLKKYLVGSEVSYFYVDFDAAVISTTDSDMFQLLEYGNTVIDTSTVGSDIKTQSSPTPASVEHLPFNQIAAFKALFGDSGDNVPPIQIGFNREAKMECVKILNNIRRRTYFVNALSIRNLRLPEPLDKLRTELHKTGQIPAYIRNSEVTWLDYCTTGFELTYPNYNIQDTLNKFDISL